MLAFAWLNALAFSVLQERFWSHLFLIFPEGSFNYSAQDNQGWRDPTRREQPSDNSPFLLRPCSCSHSNSRELKTAEVHGCKMLSSPRLATEHKNMLYPQLETTAKSVKTEILLSPSLLTSTWEQNTRQPHINLLTPDPAFLCPPSPHF